MSAIDLVEREVCWLVECPEYHPGEYFSLCECGCGRHYWEADVHKATRFRSKEEAETARGGDVNCIAVEHEFGLKLPRRGSLLERLTSHEIMPGMPRLQRPINPDGPEAADTITRLQAALTEFVQARDAWLTTTCGSHSEHMAANRLDAAHENARKAVGGG